MPSCHSHTEKLAILFLLGILVVHADQHDDAAHNNQAAHDAERGPVQNLVALIACKQVTRIP
jgi:hypothetical protein